MEFHVPASWGDEKKTNNLCNSRSDSRWLSIIRGIDFTRSGDDRNSRLSDRREYRYVGRFNTTIAFLSTILFRVRARSKRKKCGRRGRKDASLLDTVERGCSSGGGIGAFRECRRLRLMLFTQSPGYRAFLQHDWLLPRHPYGHWSFPAGS